MKLLVKTINGAKFEVEADESCTVLQVKSIIEAAKSDLPAASMKLIKSGKVLKDEDVLSTIGMKENDFLVVMITKAKKPAAAPAAAAAAPAAAAAASTPAAAPKTPAPTTSTAAATAPAATNTSKTPAATSTPAATTTVPTPAAPVAPSPEFPSEVVANLTSMGFPEEAVRHCLRAAQGNPDLAVEFLTNGIPEGITALPTGTPSTPAATSNQQPLLALRNHPQFNDLRRLVQSNPQMLQQVLTQIGQQQPQLLQEINANQALFLQMMNEPVTETSSTNASPPAQPPPADEGFGSGLGAIGNPSQMAQMINSMSADELHQMAQMMGLSPEQLRATAQMIGQMPPEQLQQFMMQAMGGGGGGSMPTGPQVLRLTEEEMAAVDRLAEMGFDRAEAAQAFLACDKNEALAANFLMDSMGDDDGGFFGGNNNNNNGGGNNNDNNDDEGGADDDEDMYD